MSKEQLFLDACGNGDMDVIDSLINQVDINCVNMYGETGLMKVCYNKEPWVIDVVQKLLSYGADVDLDDYLGTNALDIYISNGFNKELACLLLCCSKLGINRIDDNGWSYLLSCSTKESVIFLVEHGIDINMVDHNGKTMTYLKRSLSLLYH